MSTASLAAQAPLETRITFLVELARSLHQYGTGASRLEAAIGGAAGSLGLIAEVWSSPTAIIISFAETGRDEDGLARVTQVMRLAPGDVNLKRLCAADAIADRAIAGELGLREGFRALRELARPESRRAQAGVIGSYGLSAACVAALFLHSSWADLVVAWFIGLLIGGITILSGSRPQLAVASDAICALVATTVAILVSAFVVPLAVKSVIVASLIVLMPGMSLTTAVREISSQHLVSGVARMGGAVASLLKLTFGTVAASQVLTAMGVDPGTYVLPALPRWLDWPAMLIGALGFAVLFRAAWRDWPAVVVAVCVGYLATRWGGQLSQAIPGAQVGVFLGGLLLGALANLYARYGGRPGAVIREPGIILLVPGSVGFRSVSYLFERDTTLGMDSFILLITLLVSLVAGLLFGDMLVTPRRSL